MTTEQRVSDEQVRGYIVAARDDPWIDWNSEEVGALAADLSTARATIKAQAERIAALESRLVEEMRVYVATWKDAEMGRIEWMDRAESAAAQMKALQEALRRIEGRFAALEYATGKISNDDRCAMHEARDALAQNGAAHVE